MKKVVYVKVTKSYIVPVVAVEESAALLSAQQAPTNGKEIIREEAEVVQKEVVPEHFTNTHIILLECGYPVNKIADWTEVDCQAEIDAIQQT